MKDNFQRHFTNCSDLLGTCWNMLEPTSLPRACGRAFRAKVESTCFKTSAILKFEGAPWSNMEQHGATKLGMATKRTKLRWLLNVYLLKNCNT